MKFLKPNWSPLNMRSGDVGMSAEKFTYFKLY